MTPTEQHVVDALARKVERDTRNPPRRGVIASLAIAAAVAASPVAKAQPVGGGAGSSVPWTSTSLGTSCVALGIVWGNLVPGVTAGTVANNTIRTTTANAINAAILYAAQNGLEFNLEGTFQTYGGVAVPSNYPNFRSTGMATIVEFQANVPAVVVGSQTNTSTDNCYNYSIEGLYGQYGVDQTGNTSANGFVFGQCAYCNFSNVGYWAVFSSGSPIYPAYNAVMFSAGGVSPTHLGTFFSNKVVNIKAQGAQNSLWKLNLNGEGNHYDTLFLNAGSGIPVATASHCMDLQNYAYGANSNDVYTKLSIDFCKPASGKSIIFFSTCTGIVINGLHIEEAVQTGGPLIQLAGAQVTINGLLFLNTHSLAAQGATTAGSFFYLYQNEGLTVNGLTLQWGGSGYVDTTMNQIITKGGTSEQPKVVITNWDFSDAAGVVAAHLPAMDPNMPSWPTVPAQFAMYVYDPIASRLIQPQFALAGSATIYGQMQRANIIMSAGGTITLADTMKASGSGSTLKVDPNNTVFVATTSGFTGTLVVKDGGGATLSTITTASQTARYAYGATAYALFT